VKVLQPLCHLVFTRLPPARPGWIPRSAWVSPMRWLEWRKITHADRASGMQDFRCTTIPMPVKIVVEHRLRPD
jgi:hypothetical protein